MSVLPASWQFYCQSFIMFKVVIFAIVLFAASFLLINFRPGEGVQKQQAAAPLTSQEAVEKVKTLAEVKKYLTEVPGGRVDQSGSEGEFYLIQVYETKDGHTATFNWYQVDKTTGAITAEFETMETYTDPKYGIEFDYPADWEQNSGTQIFENGDIITVEKSGGSQKPQTDFYDGARFTVGVPVKNLALLDGYARRNGYSYTKLGDWIFPLFLFAEGEDKALNQKVLQEILNSVTCNEC